MEKFRKRSKNEFDQKEKNPVTRYAPDYHEGLSKNSRREYKIMRQTRR